MSSSGFRHLHHPIIFHIDNLSGTPNVLQVWVLNNIWRPFIDHPLVAPLSMCICGGKLEFFKSEAESEEQSARFQIRTRSALLQFRCDAWIRFIVKQERPDPTSFNARNDGVETIYQRSQSFRDKQHADCRGLKVDVPRPHLTSCNYKTSYQNYRDLNQMYRRISIFWSLLQASEFHTS